MVRDTINLKVLEIAIKKKDFAFLAGKLAALPHEYDWSQEDFAELARQIEDAGIS